MLPRLQVIQVCPGVVEFFIFITKILLQRVFLKFHKDSNKLPLYLKTAVEDTIFLSNARKYKVQPS